MFKKNYKCTKGKIFLPLSLVDMVFECYHTCNNFGGYPGYSRTLTKITDKFNRPKLCEIVKEKVNQCEVCKKSKPFQRRFEGELISTYSQVPMKKLYMELYVCGNRYIYIILDDFSKFVWLLPMINITSKNVIKSL